MDYDKNIALGIDIGGSHITAGLVDMDKRVVLENTIVRKKINRHGSSEEILGKWVTTIEEVQKNINSKIIGIGFAMPGPFNYEKGICLIKGFDKYESLYNMNIRNELAKRLNVEPNHILFRNDAEAFLEGEIFCGAAAGYSNAIGITLGTGLGSAISKDGITWDAELSVLEFKGEKIEEWVSTRGLVRIYKDLTGKIVNDAFTLAELTQTDNHAKETFKIFAQHFSWFLQKFIMQQSPEVVVIGGNITQSYHLFKDELMKCLLATGIEMPEIAVASLGENAQLIGGACKLITNIKIGY